MKVLVGFEESGKVREAFKKKGHYALSCDLLPSRIPGNHYQGDILDVLDQGWDIALLFPPCTYLCNSGVRWLFSDPERVHKMIDAAILFKALLETNIDKICIENPVMHGYARDIIEVRPSQIVQPWQFGHGETKATGLYLKNLPLLKPTNIVDGREARIHKMPPGPDRAKLRSETFQGIADAMADQWG